MLSPASGNVNYHNAYEGGYIDHVINVSRNAIRMMRLYKEAGGIIDFEQEELLFAAFHHDLGKLGDVGNLHYIKNDSEWHIKNRGEVYKSNTDLSYLTHTDRTFFLLNKYGIQYTEKEYFGILKYSNSSLEAVGLKPGALVVFTPNSEFEFIINNERLYCMKSNDIALTHEYEGNEKEYNPSWA